MGLPLETREVDGATSVAPGPRPSLPSFRTTSLHPRLPSYFILPMLASWTQVASLPRLPNRTQICLKNPWPGRYSSPTDSSTAPQNRIEYGTGLGPGKGTLQPGDKTEKRKNIGQGIKWFVSVPTGHVTMEKSLPLSGTVGGLYPVALRCVPEHWQH